jgi:hypothetical protein
MHALCALRLLPAVQIQRAKTDAYDGLEWDNPERPEAKNLLTIYQCVTGKSRVSGRGGVARPAMDLGIAWGLPCWLSGDGEVRGRGRHLFDL